MLVIVISKKASEDKSGLRNNWYKIIRWTVYFNVYPVTAEWMLNFIFFFNLSFIAPRLDAGSKWNVCEAFVHCVFRKSVLPLKQGTLVASNYKNMSKFIHQRQICRSYRNQSVDLKFKSIEWFLCNRNIGCYWNNFLQIFFQINVLKNFAIFIKKQLCQSLFFNKISKKRLQHRRFLLKSAKLRRTPFFTEHLR